MDGVSIRITISPNSTVSRNHRIHALQFTPNGKVVEITDASDKAGIKSVEIEDCNAES